MLNITIYITELRSNRDYNTSLVWKSKNQYNCSYSVHWIMSLQNWFEMTRRDAIFSKSFFWFFNIHRYSSVPESWVKWKSFVMIVLERSLPGCNLGYVVTSPGKNSKSYKNNVWLSKFARETCGNTSNCAHGHGTNCGKRSDLFSTSPVSRMRLP